MSGEFMFDDRSLIDELRFFVVNQGQRRANFHDVAFVDDDNVRLAQEDEDIRGDRILSGTVKAPRKCTR